MRVLILAALCAALAACGTEPAASPPPVAPEQSALAGRYRAASETARDVTGDVAIQRGGLLFDRGVVLYTRLLRPRSAHEAIARGGDSYAAAAVGPSDLIIELRRVTEQTVSAGGRSLCGADAPSYVALAYEARATSVTVLVFAGEEPPGPQATNSRLCATLAYAARDGARTSEGVVL